MIIEEESESSTGSMNFNSKSILNPSSGLQNEKAVISGSLVIEDFSSQSLANVTSQDEELNHPI